ncbi:MAG: hypothetical protein V7L23_22710 [Nostoc sp.]|uniref:hypothetical protein n=1 Tax=Nostoc sp. TaxID=1180 RepID=UPI002FF2B314
MHFSANYEQSTPLNYFLIDQWESVKQFWILDLQFGIDPDHKGTGLGDLRLTILDLFRLTSGGA